MEKAQILFVDDNQAILDGLRRALRSDGRRWDISFANSGEEALAFMSARKVDAVITDVRMPGLDGVQLLQKISQLYPDVIRFILSGHASEEVILQAAKLTHQFFPKPCNVDKLKSALVRALALRNLLADERLRAVVSGIGSLPSLPKTYSEIVEKLASPEVSVHEIGETISGDPAISAKILQLVNSGFFGLGKKISNAGEAATLLGLDTIKHLVLSVEVFSQFDEQKLNYAGFLLDEFIAHSAKVGFLAKQIATAERASREVVDESYLSGFLHDVGKLIMVDNMPAEYKKVLELQQAEQMAIQDAEHAVIGTDHGVIGAYLLGLWGFSDTVQEAVAFHHAPGNTEATVFVPLTSVHVANVLENAGSEELAESAGESIDFAYLSRLDLESHLPAWQTLCEQAGDE